MAVAAPLARNLVEQIVREVVLAQMGGPPGKPGILYHYAPSRSAAVAKALLQDYAGVVQTDGYAGYDFLDLQPGTVHAGCLAHVRRKFDEAKKGLGKATNKTGSADVALSETNAALTTSGTLTSADVDNPANAFTAGTIVGTIGTFSIDAAGAWTFTANSAFDSLNVGQNVNETRSEERRVGTE